MGNRSSKKKGTKTTTYTYTRGNLLSAISSTGNYYYNCDGVRYKKVSGGVTTEYYLDGDKILGEDRSDGKKLRYFYDIDGLCGVRYNGKDYEYVRNPYGDIVMIVIDGLPVVRYYYDAWGNCKMVQYKDGADIGNINPFRWKSHYYDVESGLYYANGSYYDPEAGLHVDAMPVSTAIENAFEVFGLDLNGIMCDNILAYLPYVYSAFTTIELTANQGYDPNANKSGWEIFWNGVKQSLANLSGAQKIGIVVGLLLVLVACVVVMVLAPEASAAVAAMGRVVIGFLIGVASSVAISTVTAMATGGDVAEAFVSSLADSILICGILAFVGAGISVIKAGVRSVRNAKLAGSSQIGAQPQSTLNQNGATRNFELDPRSIEQAKRGSPSWDTFRKRVWQNEATFRPGKYGSQVKRMSQGLAPQVDGVSMQLHHVVGKANDMYNVVKLLFSKFRCFKNGSCKLRMVYS